MHFYYKIYFKFIVYRYIIFYIEPCLKNRTIEITNIGNRLIPATINPAVISGVKEMLCPIANKLIPIIINTPRAIRMSLIIFCVVYP